MTPSPAAVCAIQQFFTNLVFSYRAAAVAWVLFKVCVYIFSAVNINFSTLLHSPLSQRKVSKKKGKKIQ